MRSRASISACTERKAISSNREAVKILKREPQSEAERAFVDAVTAIAAGLRDRRKAAQVFHRTIGIQLQVGYVRRRIHEMGRVREIEGLCPELCAHPLGDPESP